MSEQELVGDVGFNGERARALSATLELNGLDSDEADWTLDVKLEGPLPQLLLSGTVVTPVLPGPARLRVAYVDAPSEVSVRGRAGGLTNGGKDLYLTVAQRGSDVRIEGDIVLEWFDFEQGSAPFGLVVGVDATLAG